MGATACVCGTQSFMYVAEAATVLKVSKSFLYGGLREGRFPGVMVGNSYRMHRDFVRGFVSAPAGTRFADYAAEWLAREAEAIAS